MSTQNTCSAHLNTRAFKKKENGWVLNRAQQSHWATLGPNHVLLLCRVLIAPTSFPSFPFVPIPESERSDDDLMFRKYTLLWLNVAAWLFFIPNMIVAEVYIRYIRRVASRSPEKGSHMDDTINRNSEHNVSTEEGRCYM